MITATDKFAQAILETIFKVYGKCYVGLLNIHRLPGGAIDLVLGLNDPDLHVHICAQLEEDKFIEYQDKEEIPNNEGIGIDLGIKDLVVLSDGTKYTNPKELNKREKQLKRLQRKLARQINHSKNYNKTKIKLARVHSKIKNSRKNNIINIVNEIVKEYDCIISEKLNVKGIIQNHKLAKSIVDSSFNKICQLLKWKTKILGKYYYQVDNTGNILFDQPLTTDETSAPYMVWKG